MVGKAVSKSVKREIKTQLGLVYTDLKEAKEERVNLKQKYFNLVKKVRDLENALREKARSESDDMDYGV